MAAWTEGMCRTNGIEMHYWRTDGDKPPVVLLHGLTDNGACWTQFARTLEAEYDFIMPDARGHGRSSVPDRGYRFDDHADDVVGLIAVLELDRPVLIGHSMGGTAAALVAGRNPPLIRGAILEDPVFLSIDMHRKFAEGAWAKQHSQVLETPLNDVVAGGHARNPQWTLETLELWARAKHETKMRVFEILTASCPDFRRVVKAIHVPTLLVTGEPERGVLVSSETATELQALNPNLRVEHIPGAGHCIRYDQPERFAGVVHAFLREILA